ncbi:double zinc ribbon domain-containing protein [Oribacterium sp. P6A1]|uniref:double zinc ribbon domain-containing protein n=1 Tax=Oribacterium sp. P6A1 TaxID=1410612 RepID=UPI00068AFB20|nr:zinc ribbon domain-containing protein [Oribacterium sp. P6A1]
MAGFCRYCGTKLQDNASICGGCGKPVPNKSPQKMGINNKKFCGNCGSALTPEARFCRACGWKVPTDADSPASSQRGNNTAQNIPYRNPVQVPASAQNASSHSSVQDIHSGQTVSQHGSFSGPASADNANSTGAFQGFVPTSNSSFQGSFIPPGSGIQQNHAGEKEGFSLFTLSRMNLFLLLSVFMFNAGPSLFCSVRMTQLQSFLSDSQVKLCGFSARFMGTLFLMAVFLCMSGTRISLPGRAAKVLLGLTPLYFALSLSMFVASNFVSSFSILPVFLLAVIMSLIMVAAGFSATVDAVSLKARGFIRNLLLLIRHPLNCFLWLMAFLTITLVQTAVTFGLLLVRTSTTLTSDYVSWLLISVAETLVISLILKSMAASSVKWISQNSIPKNVRNRMAATAGAGMQFGMHNLSSYFEPQPQPDNGTPVQGNVSSEKSSSHPTGLLSFLTPVSRESAITALVLTVLGSIMFLIRPSVPASDWKREIESEINSDLALSNYTLVAGSVPDAMVYADRATEKIALLDAYLRNDGWALLSSAKRTGDTRTWLMYLALQGSDESKVKDAVGKLEESVISAPMNLDLKGLLLECYETGLLGEMESYQENYRKEIVTEYVLDGIYTHVLPEIPENGPELENTLEKLKKHTSFISDYRNALSDLDQIGKKGKLEGNDIDKFIKRAEENPDEVGLQYIAAYAASEGASDDTRYLFERARERTLRFLELVKKDNDPDALRKAGIMAVQMLLKLRGYREAADILSGIDTRDVPELKEKLTTLKLSALNGLEDPAEAYVFTKDLLENGTETPELLFKYGVAALKYGKREEMIDALERLSTYMLDEGIKGKELYQIETWFYVMCTYITFNDDSNYTGYSYSFFGSLSDEEKQSMFSPFLLHYLTAMDKGYRRYIDIAEEELSAVLETRSDLTYAKYLRGVIAFADHDYETAAKYYKMACDVDPENTTFLFGLANAYDGLEDYQKAYELCLRIQAMVPTVNHDEDWYGIGYHNTQLLNRLKDRLKEE